MSRKKEKRAGKLGSGSRPPLKAGGPGQRGTGRPPSRGGRGRRARQAGRGRRGAMGLRAAPGRLWPQGSEHRAGPCQVAGVHDMLLSQKADTWSVTQPGALWFFFSFFFSVTTIQAFFLRDGPGLSRKPGPAVAAPAGGQPRDTSSEALPWSGVLGQNPSKAPGGRGSRGHARPREGSRLAGRAAARSGAPRHPPPAGQAPPSPEASRVGTR